MEALAQHLRPLPPDLWTYLLPCDGGFAAISPGDSQYVPGPAAIGQQQERNVAFVSVQDLAAGNERPLHVIAHLIDHYLGCRGEADGLWLSQGGGLTSCWRKAAKRLPQLYALGYGLDAVALSSVRDYFAQSLAAYCRDRQRLNVADPQICKWLRNTLWNRAYWPAPEPEQHPV
jgi:hypothetical protein